MEGEEDSNATLSTCQIDDDLGVLWLICFHCYNVLNFDGINLN